MWTAAAALPKRSYPVVPDLGAQGSCLCWYRVLHFPELVGNTIQTAFASKTVWHGSCTERWCSRAGDTRDTTPQFAVTPTPSREGKLQRKRFNLLEWALQPPRGPRPTYPCCEVWHVTESGEALVCCGSGRVDIEVEQLGDAVVVICDETQAGAADVAFSDATTRFGDFEVTAAVVCASEHFKTRIRVGEQWSTYDLHDIQPHAPRHPVDRHEQLQVIVYTRKQVS